MKSKIALYSTTVLMIAAVSSSAEAEEHWTFDWHASEVTDLAFSTNGHLLYTTSLRGDRISQMKVAGKAMTDFGTAVGKLTGKRSHAVAVSPHGKRVAVSGFRHISMFSVQKRELLWRSEIQSKDFSPPFIDDLTFSPDGSRLACSGTAPRVGGRHGLKAGRIVILEAGTGDAVGRYDDLSTSVTTIRYSPDGRLFAAGTTGAGGELPESGALLLFDSKSKKLLHTWNCRDSVRPGTNLSSINCFAFHPNGRQISIAVSDGAVQLWQIASREVRATVIQHTKAATTLAYSPDGKWLATAGGDRSVRLWNCQTSEEVSQLELDTPKINAIAFSRDGSLLGAGGGDFLRSGTVRIWDLGGVLK